MQQATQQQDGSNEQHEHEVEEHEAYQYWGYLFKPDKTGTDKLKGLLSGLKDVMVRPSLYLGVTRHGLRMTDFRDRCRMNIMNHPTRAT